MHSPRPSIRVFAAIWPVTALVLAPACGPQKPVNPADGWLGIAAALPESPSRAAPYDFSSGEILERMLGKVSGATSRRAWLFTKDMLRRSHDEDVINALSDYLSKHLLSTQDSAPAINALEIMKGSEDARYGPAAYQASASARQTIRKAALETLVSCGTPEIADQIMANFGLWDPLSQALMLRIIAKVQSPEKAAPFFRRVLDGRIAPQHMKVMRVQVLAAFDEGAKDETVRKTLEGNLGSFSGSELLSAARLLQLAGGEEGRLHLIDVLGKTQSVPTLLLCIKALGQRNAAASLQAVQRFLVYDNPTVVAEVATFLGKVDDDNARRALEGLASHYQLIVRRAAYAALAGRGATGNLQRVAERIETATGTEFRQALKDAVLARYAKAIPPAVKRLATAEGPQRRAILQMFGAFDGPEPVEPLIAEFLAPPKVLLRDKKVDSVTYAAMMLANHDESSARLMELYDQLSGDEVRRSQVMLSLSGIAKTTPDADVRKRVFGWLRARLYDDSETDRARLQALRHLGADLSIRDALELKQLVARVGKTKHELAKRINAFLWEMF